MIFICFIIFMFYKCFICFICFICFVISAETETGFTKPLNDVIVEDLNQPMVFICEVASDNLKPEWLKNGKPFKPTNRIKFISQGKEHRMEIASPVLVDDEAEYTVFFRPKNLKSTGKLILKGELSFEMCHYQCWKSLAGVWWLFLGRLGLGNTTCNF